MAAATSATMRVAGQSFSLGIAALVLAVIVGRHEIGPSIMCTSSPASGYFLIFRRTLRAGSDCFVSGSRASSTARRIEAVVTTCLQKCMRTCRVWPSLPEQISEAAVGRTVADVLAPGLVVLFVGINPGLIFGRRRSSLRSSR